MRTRQIKPGFFKNSSLCALNPYVRILFSGLWGLADRDGKLKYDINVFGSELFPHEFNHKCGNLGDRYRYLAAHPTGNTSKSTKDEKFWAGKVIISAQDLKKWLNLLENKHHILVYDVDDKKYILIIEFKKHQNPHIKEAKSIIPDPPQSKKIKSPVQSPVPSTIQLPFEAPCSAALVPVLNTVPIPLTGASAGAVDTSKKEENQEGKKHQYFAPEFREELINRFLSLPNPFDEEKYSFQETIARNTFFYLFMEFMDNNSAHNYRIDDSATKNIISPEKKLMVFYTELNSMDISFIEAVFAAPFDEFNQRICFEFWMRRIRKLRKSNGK